MKELVIQSRQLNKKIQASPEYNRYLVTKEKLMADGELYRKMNEFRKRNFELQNKGDGVNRYDEIRNLASEYNLLLHNALVNDFLMAEQRICRLMQDIYKELARDIEFDFEYMDM